MVFDRFLQSPHDTLLHVFTHAMECKPEEGGVSLKTLFMGTSPCGETEVAYYLLAEESEGNGGQYGLRVEYGAETETILKITESQCAILELLAALARGAVTPVTVRDVVEDWLLL